MSTTCPVCRWENESDSGPCGGCGRDLAGNPGPAAVPEPRPYLDDPVVPAPIPGPEPEAPVIHRVAEPVAIRPQARPVPRTIEPSRDAPRAVDLSRVPRPAETARRAPAPVRDIPVVVAPTTARAAVRFRDNEVSLDAGPLAAPERLPLGPATRLCPSCGTAVESSRRFCRCGARLPVAGTDRARGAPSTAEGWTTPAFRRAQRAANGGRRARYDAALSGRVYAVRAVLVVLLVLLLGSQAPPWGSDVRHWVQTRVEQALPGH